MFMRLVQLNVDARHKHEFNSVYQKEVIDRLQKTRGCRFAGLIESGAEESESISFTLWDTQEQAED